jgi:hypothetical protein
MPVMEPSRAVFLSYGTGDAWSVSEHVVRVRPANRFDPFIVRYKDDPRFAAFCRKVGLPAPKKATAHESS